MKKISEGILLVIMCQKSYNFKRICGSDEGEENDMNYQRELDKLVKKLAGEEHVPRLLLHSCCAPCSSYVLEYLSNYFEITVFYYNPNIFPESEYTKRIWEQQMLIDKLPAKHPVSFMAGRYDKERHTACRGVRRRISSVGF